MLNMRGQAAIVGIGETPWYKRGTSPHSEFSNAIRAIVAASDDAGIDPADIDGFVSWGSERNSGTYMMGSLGTKELRFGSLVWTHGGGSAGSIGLAATGVATGQTDYCVVIRSMAETDSNSRLNVAVNQGGPPAMARANGMVSPAQLIAIEAERSFHDGLSRDALWAFVEASYHHANRNPNAYGREMRLDREDYDNARMPVEPLKLFDNSRENDKAIALIITSAERAKDLRQPPAYILSSMHGRYGDRDHSFSESPDGRRTSGYRAVAKRMWEQSGYQPADVDVTQVYSNTSIFGLVGMIDHGLVTWENVNEQLTFENLIAPSGRLPINTAGGDLADGFLHGAGNNIEGVRQIRGTSPNQVPDAQLSLIFGGPGDAFTSTTLLGTEATL